LTANGIDAYRHQSVQRAFELAAAGQDDIESLVGNFQAASDFRIQADYELFPSITLADAAQQVEFAQQFIEAARRLAADLESPHAPG
jgi:uncharacterized protein (UPF0332 family)